MKSLKWLIPIGIIGLMLMSIYSMVVGFNNNSVVLREDVRNSWGNVESSYQRRNDLIGKRIPNIKIGINKEQYMIKEDEEYLRII